MVCVGYGIERNVGQYWILKNTWGPLWGENGFIKISQKGNIANIHGGKLFTIKKSTNIPTFPHRSLAKLRKTNNFYGHLGRF